MARLRTAERLLQALLTTVGLVAMATGAFALVTGSSGMPGEIEANATVESELRYFAAFWIAYGAVAFRTASRVATATTAVRALALAMFIGGVGRGPGLDRRRPTACRVRRADGDRARAAGAAGRLAATGRQGFELIAAG